VAKILEPERTPTRASVNCEWCVEVTSVSGEPGWAPLQHGRDRLVVIGGVVGDRLHGGGEFEQGFQALVLSLTEQAFGHAQSVRWVHRDIGSQAAGGFQ